MEFLSLFEEIRAFGRDIPLTVNFIGTLVTAYLGSWGYYKQQRNVHDLQSGASVSVSNIIFSSSVYAMMFVGGLQTLRLAMLVNGLARLPLLVAIFIGLAKYKTFTKREAVATGAVALFIASSYVIPDRLLLFFVANVGMAIFVGTQAYDIGKEKHVGVVAPQMLVTATVSLAFWTAYGFAVHDWHLWGGAGLVFLAFLATDAVWLAYRRTYVPRPKPVRGAVVTNDAPFSIWTHRVF